jgi:hypothetical protein
VRYWPPQLRGDCSNLVTAWANHGSPTLAQDEHKLLGEAMMALALVRHPTLPVETTEVCIVHQMTHWICGRSNTGWRSATFALSEKDDAQQGAECSLGHAAQAPGRGGRKEL